MKNAMGGLTATHAFAMAVASFGVVLVDLAAMVKWPVHDTPGIVGKMLLLAVALVELVVPCGGYLGIAAALRSSPHQRGPKIAFWLFSVIAVPLALLGLYIGVSALQR